MAPKHSTMGDGPCTGAWLCFVLVYGCAHGESCWGNRVPLPVLSCHAVLQIMCQERLRHSCLSACCCLWGTVMCHLRHGCGQGWHGLSCTTAWVVVENVIYLYHQVYIGHMSASPQGLALPGEPGSCAAGPRCSADTQCCSGALHGMPSCYCHWDTDTTGILILLGY
jgi:hypothetical protein